MAKENSGQFKPELNEKMEVGIEELNIITSLLLEAMDDTDDLQGVKEFTKQLKEETDKRLNMIRAIKGGKRSIREYRQFMILDYLKKHGDIKDVNRSEMMKYAGINKLDILYRYIGTMIQEDLIDFDMHEWSNHAGKFMK